MSTIPRVPSAVPGEPATLRSALAHCPQPAATFHRRYAAMWSEGVVPQLIKDTARMRNARVTDCGFCKNVRFDGARRSGLTEEHVALIDDGYLDSELSDVQKLVLRYTDAFLLDPSVVDEQLRAEMSEQFTPPEIVELTLALAMFLGMAKVLISLGTEPEQMDTTILPTPGSVQRAS
jgi:alkylhydroperoxidase family enzyme